MHIHTVLPLIALLALAACKDEKKADTTGTASPPTGNTVAPTPPPANPSAPSGAPANPPPASKPGQ
ncbi:hypothetical protein [Methylobacterium nodulans]|uniref:Uncharacterized protein n=1 Tax=Methylobacterium nodulans (strain LMG 21967 / CNCM I-2342 / ORS 2060) TaxID=460265 RepID=B8IEQ1_METNO|nr:hypothetical protein [Methylobacterium nodulans]ACL61394.1 conserved hypothetical protein [Methylobacterium nodulans ORS 2060]